MITAVKNGHKKIMEALLSRHVEIDAIGSQGKTALHHAIEKGNLDLVRAILEYKPGILHYIDFSYGRPRFKSVKTFSKFV